MTGSGYKTFTAGDVLTASDVQGHLQDQSVMYFGSSALRASGIGTANYSEGMMSYLADTNSVEYYDGSNWTAVGTTPGLVHINTTSFSAVASQSVNDVFSATYDNYFLVTQIVGSTSADVQLRVRVGGTDLTTSTYLRGEYYVGLQDSVALTSSTNTTTTFIPLVGINSGYPSFSYTQISQPFLADETVINAQSSGRHTRSVGAMVNNNTSYTGYTLVASAGTITGKATLYGYKL